MAKRVWTDVARDASYLRDADDHPVHVAPVDRTSREWPEDQPTCCWLSAACFQRAEDRNGHRPRRGPCCPSPGGEGRGARVGSPVSPRCRLLPPQRTARR
jgi:hypothetical protein